MQKTTAAETLRKSILVLEQRQIEEGRLLIEQFKIINESLKPANVLRKIIQGVAAPSELKEDLVQTTAALITGYLMRKIVVRSSKNPILRVAGIFLQYGVTNFVARNSESIKAVGLFLISKLEDIYDKHKS